MRKLAVVFVAAIPLVLAGTGAAATTTVDQFSDGPFPDEICGVTGTTTVHGTSVFRDLGGGAFFASGTLWVVFTADTGKSITIFAAGPITAPQPAIDEQAGTVTFLTSYRGLPEKLSITNGPTLSRDAGTVTFTDVFTYSGNPDEPVDENSVLISSDFSSLHGPHPDLLSDFELFCDVLQPYLIDP